MKDWLFVAVCFSPLLALGVAVVAVAASWPWWLLAVLGGYVGGAVVQPSFYRAFMDLYRHGVHNDR